MYQIGEFSLITRLSIKTLRYYHEKGILEPDYIDEESGYRYYRENSLDRVHVIQQLRNLEFSIKEIQIILANYSDDMEILEFLEKQKRSIDEKLNRYENLSRSIEVIIQNIRSIEMDNINTSEIEIKEIEDIIFAGYRFKGKYSDVGNAFSKVGKKAGRLIAGQPMTLYYQDEYMEENADIEGGFPLSKSIKSDDIHCRVLPGGKSITIIHKGPYETLGKSYKKIIEFVKENSYSIELPTREIYHRGPGMIFKGNPEKYLTEIQMLIR